MRFALKRLQGFLVDATCLVVGINNPPLAVQGNKSFGDTLQDIDRLQAQLRSATCCLQLPDP